MGDDFIINGDVLEAYVGNPDITDLFHSRWYKDNQQ